MDDVWQIERFQFDEDALDRYLRDGWEPFAAVVQFNQHYVYVRKPAPTPSKE